MGIPKRFKETSIFKPNAIADAIANATAKATKYITDITNDGIWVHPEGAGPDSTTHNPISTTYGWHISDVLEYFKAGSSWIKLWVASGVSKLRLGPETSGHTVLDSTGMEVFTDASSSVAQFGGTARVGKASGANFYTDGSSLMMRNGTSVRAKVNSGGTMELTNGATSPNRVVIGIDSATYSNPGVTVYKSGAEKFDIRTNGSGAQTSCVENMYLMGYANSGSRQTWVRCGDGAIASSTNISALSDRRLKEHVAYLGDDAVSFARSLKPVLYRRNGKPYVGFYAQDVAEADPWDALTSTDDDMLSGLDGGVMALDYQALIAPLVAYCQQLEERIIQIEQEE